MLAKVYKQFNPFLTLLLTEVWKGYFKTTKNCPPVNDLSCAQIQSVYVQDIVLKM